MARPNPDDDRDLFAELDDDLLNDDSGGNAPADTSSTTSAFDDDPTVPGQVVVDVYETKNDVVVMAPTPGATKGDIEISLVDNTLTIRGSRRQPEDIPEENYLAHELHWGEFSRQIVLPTQVKEEGAEAVLRDGILTVRLPKAEQDKVKKIDIK